MLFYTGIELKHVARPVESDLPISTVSVSLFVCLPVRTSGRSDGHLLGDYKVQMSMLAVLRFSCSHKNMNNLLSCARPFQTRRYARFMSC